MILYIVKSFKLTLKEMVENLILTANLNRVNFIATLIKNVYKRVSRKELLKRNKLLHRRSNEFKFFSFFIYFFSTNSFFKIPYECRFVSLSGKENPF